MNKTCEKCGREYPSYHPWCTENKCLETTITNIDRPESGGIFSYLVGYKYPVKGYPDAVVVGQNATVKRTLIATIRLITKAPFSYLVPILFLLPFRRKIIKHCIYWLAEIYTAEFEKHQLPLKQFRLCLQEFIRVGEKVITVEGEYRDKALKVLHCLAMFLEFDAAYVYRFQDIFENLDKASLDKNTRKELIRLFNLLIEREGVKEIPKDQQQANKARSIASLLNLALLVSPMIRRFIRSFLFELNIDNIRPDILDRYYMARYFDYNFEGKTFAERHAWKLEEEKNWEQPVLDASNMAAVNVSPNNYVYQLTETQAVDLAEHTRNTVMKLYNDEKKKQIEQALKDAGKID